MPNHSEAQRQEHVMQEYVLDPCATVQLLDSGEEENLSRNEDNNRHSEAKTEELVESFHKDSHVELMAGVPVLVATDRNNKYTLLTYGHRVRALYRGLKRFPNNKHFIDIKKKGLRHCIILNKKSPKDIRVFTKNLGNRYAGSKYNFEEFLKDTKMTIGIVNVNCKAIGLTEAGTGHGEFSYVAKVYEIAKKKWPGAYSSQNVWTDSKAAVKALDKMGLMAPLIEVLRNEVSSDDPRLRNDVQIANIHTILVIMNKMKPASKHETAWKSLALSYLKCCFPRRVSNADNEIELVFPLPERERMTSSQTSSNVASGAQASAVPIATS